MDQHLSDHIERLKKAVENTLKVHLCTPRDFDQASEAIALQTRIRLSRTTLMRIWGYVREEVAPRETTLNTLAMFCGYASWNDFINRTTTSPTPQSNPLMGYSIDTARDIPIGTTLTIVWQPGRSMTIRHEGEGRFTVLDSQNTRLLPDSTFRCLMLIENEPMFASDVVINENHIPAYVCGRDTGIHIVNDDLQ